MIFRFLSWIIAISVVSGCSSYPFGTNDRPLPGGYNKIAIPIFVNRTAEPGIEPYFATALTEQVNRAHVAQVTDRGDAQVVVDGEVLSIRFEQGPLCNGDLCKAPFAKSLPTNTVLTTQYRVIVNVNLILRRISDDSVLWSGDFKAEQQYASPEITQEATNASDPLYNQSARTMVVKTIARALMQEAYSRMTENF